MTHQAAFEQWAGLPAGSMPDWEFIPLYRGDSLAAVAAMWGTEIHFAVAPGWKHKTIHRGRTRDFLSPLFNRRGYLTTRMTVGDDDSFIRRLGFNKTWDNDQMSHYMMTKLPFGKGE